MFNNTEINLQPEDFTGEQTRPISTFMSTDGWGVVLWQNKWSSGDTGGFHGCIIKPDGTPGSYRVLNGADKYPVITNHPKGSACLAYDSNTNKLMLNRYGTTLINAREVEVASSVTYVPGPRSHSISTNSSNSMGIALIGMESKGSSKKRIHFRCYNSEFGLSPISHPDIPSLPSNYVLQDEVDICAAEVFKSPRIIIQNYLISCVAQLPSADFVIHIIKINDYYTEPPFSKQIYAPPSLDDKILSTHIAASKIEGFFAVLWVEGNDRKGYKISFMGFNKDGVQQYPKVTLPGYVYGLSTPCLRFDEHQKLFVLSYTALEGDKHVIGLVRFNLKGDYAGRPISQLHSRFKRNPSVMLIPTMSGHYFVSWEVEDDIKISKYKAENDTNDSKDIYGVHVDMNVLFSRL